MPFGTWNTLFECNEINAAGDARRAGGGGAGRRATKVVLSSSAAIYGDNPGRAEGRDDAAGAEESLRQHEAGRVSSTARCSPTRAGMPAACLRYFNVFGPRQDPKSQYAAAVPYLH